MKLKLPTQSEKLRLMKWNEEKRHKNEYLVLVIILKSTNKILQ